MIQFSNIFGEGKDREKEEGLKYPQEKEDKDSSNIDFASLKAKGDEAGKEKDASKIDFSALDREAEKKAAEETVRLSSAKSLYDKATGLAAEIFNQELDLTRDNFESVCRLAEELSENVTSGNQDLLAYVFAEPSEDRGYFPVNLVNVCVLSLEMGAGFGFSRAHLLKLGVLAFLHDINMRGSRTLSSRGSALSIHDLLKGGEFSSLNEETINGSLKHLNLAIFDIVAQAYKRVKNFGPSGDLKEGDIRGYIQVINFIDIYEALRQQRVKGKKRAPLDILKIIMANKQFLSPRLIKVFIERIGLYPKGTLVKLNTREEACVIKHNCRLLSSPVVRVIYDREGNRLEKGRVINLSEGAKICITRGF